MASSSLTRAACGRLESLEFTHVHVYQPQHLFRPNGRKHTRCADPGDPWLMFATLGDVVYQGIGDTPGQAADAVIEQAASPALYLLGVEIAILAHVIRG